MEEKRFCEGCGKELPIGSHWNRRYCIDCRPNKVENKTCVTCGKPLPKNKQKYCSRGCYPDRNRPCATCGNPLPGAKRKYCSPECEPHSYCVDCGIGITPGYARCVPCSNKDPNKASRHSEYMNNLYQDPIEREKQSERMKRVWDKNPNRRVQQAKVRRGRKHTRESLYKMSCARKEAWESGMYDSKEYRERISERVKAAHASGVYDNIWTNERRRKASKSNKKTWSDPELLKRHSEMAKSSWTDERRKTQSRLSKTRWADPKKRREMIASMKIGLADPKVKKKVSIGISRGIRKAHQKDPMYSKRLSNARRQNWEDGVYDGVFTSPTSIEVAVTEALDRVGISHISQWRPEDYTKVYDEYVPSSNLLLEVHGSYWHSFPEAQENDLEKACWAHDNGYKFIAIWDFHLKEYGADFLVEKWILPLNPDKISGEQRHYQSRLF